MTKFYRVLKGGRQCLMQGPRQQLQPGDIICTTFGQCMLKIATPSTKSVTTCMFNSEPSWEQFKGWYEEITDLNEIRPFLPHLTTGKKFYLFAGNIKREMLERVMGASEGNGA